MIVNLLVASILLLDQYTDYAKGPKGSFQAGEIEIIDDPIRMEAISKKMNRDVGVISQDKYLIWINDAVQFPSGAEGIYARILWRSSLNGPPGVAVLIRDEDSVYLNCNYRHATRSWELELPRGNRNTFESIEEAARREVQEETGINIKELKFLGNMTPDSGLTNSVIPVFSATIESQVTPNREESEAIEEIIKVPFSLLKTGLKEGFLMIDGRKVNVRDSFLSYAILLELFIR